MLLGALCTIAKAQVAAYDLTSPFTYLGGAGPSGSGIDLVSHGNDSAGAAWVDSPFELPAGGQFHATFDVRLEPEFLPGGGLVFVLQSAGPTAFGAEGSGLGYAGIAPSVAVELDVLQSDLPYGDGLDNHVGVDVDGSVDSVARADLPLALESWDGLRARVDYVDGQLSVGLAAGDGDPFAGPALQTAVAIPDGPLWVGFTASSTDSHGSRWIDGFTFVADGPGETEPTDPDEETTDDEDPPDTGVVGLGDSGGPLPRVFFCGCSSADGPGVGPAAVLLLGLLRRRARR